MHARKWNCQRRDPPLRRVLNPSNGSLSLETAVLRDITRQGDLVMGQPHYPPLFPPPRFIRLIGKIFRSFLCENKRRWHILSVFREVYDEYLEFDACRNIRFRRGIIDGSIRTSVGRISSDAAKGKNWKRKIKKSILSSLVEKLIKKQPIRSRIILEKLAGCLYGYFDRSIKWKLDNGTILIKMEICRLRESN